MRWLILLLFAEIAFAQAPGSAPPAAAPASTPPQDRCHVEGTLVNRVTGMPVRKGYVTLVAVRRGMQPQNAGNANGYTVTSNADGKFVFDDVDPGQYAISADRGGYIRTNYRSNSGAIFTLTAGQRIKDIRIALVPQGVIAGRVVDEDGDPITDARVQAQRWVMTGGIRTLRGSQQIPVDDQGNFRIANLSAGRYVLSADYSRNLPVNACIAREAYVTTFYPGAVDIQEATSISLAPGGEVTNAEIRLRKARVFHVHGKIVDSSGAPVRRMAMALVAKNTLPGLGFIGRSIAISNDGVFDFVHVRPGNYSIEPANNVFFGGSDQNDTGSNKKIFGRYPVAVTNEDIKDLVVNLGSGAVVTGNIVTEGGESPPPPESDGNKPQQQPTNKPLPTVRLAPLDSTIISGYNARSKPDGTFEQADIAPERYRVEVSGLAEGAYIKSVRFGNEDITYGVLDLTAGSGGAIDIKLSPNGAAVSGSVHNDKSETVGDVVVTLAPASVETAQKTLFFRQTRTDASGKFRFRGIPPGEYRVLAWEEVDNEQLGDPEFRAHLDSNGAVVKLIEGARETADVIVIPREAIELEAAKVR